MPRQYKLEKMCDNCPFAEEGKGLQLRLSLNKGRWRDILKGLRQGQHFLCHKTTTDGEEDEDGNYIKAGKEKICAGSRFYQQGLGIISDAEQVMERIHKMSMVKSSNRKQPVNKQEKGI